MLADNAVLRPESDGEQGSFIGKLSNWNVLPSISLQTSAATSVEHEVVGSHG